jgi:hypothetical protein
VGAAEARTPSLLKVGGHKCPFTPFSFNTHKAKKKNKNKNNNNNKW